MSSRLARSTHPRTSFGTGGSRVPDGPAHPAGPMRAVWFADPDGNILNLGTTG